MVAYSFQTRFVEPILSGAKTQTIRGHRRRHVRPGEEVQLFTGMRTKGCRLIAKRICSLVVPIRLTFSRTEGEDRFTVYISASVDGRRLAFGDLVDLARADGFNGANAVDGECAVADMAAFWFRHHAARRDRIDFDGVLVKWARLP